MIREIPRFNRLVGAVTLVLATAAVAQDAEVIPITVDSIQTIRITITARGELVSVEHDAQPGGVSGGSVGCGAVTYTAPNNFEGNAALALQAGFQEEEVAYASYPIDPASFPVKLETFEMVFGQQSTVPTRTEWTLLVWDGPPDPRLGIRILEVSWDDFSPPMPLQIDAGTAATNVVVQILPDDPEQIFVGNDSGFNMISVGYRIDAHSDPTPDGFECLLPPSANSNAFPAADQDGVSHLSDNWLNALLCGGPCDGLNRFSELPTGVCRPSGDWVIRATYSCTLVGACCDVNAACTDNIDNTNCESQGGTFMGDGTACNDVECPVPVGACCFGGECLVDLEEPLCSALSGVYMGNGSACEEVLCNEGACCLADGSCDDTIEVECDATGGIFQGGTDCATFACPQPIGSCCINGVCIPGQQRDTCESLGTFNGVDSTCSPDPCVECPVASIFESEPPSGTIDARAPYDVFSALPRWGIGSDVELITVRIGADDAPAGCFSLCETDTDPVLGPNGIDFFQPLGEGAYLIGLDHGIVAGSTTILRYEGQAEGIGFRAHPGNTSGDWAADGADVEMLMGVLSGAVSSQHGTYGFDLDHSGAKGPADLLRLIDLLLGAGQYESWQGTAVSSPTCP